MNDTVDVQATPVDPLLTKSVTLEFTINEVNGLLRLLGELPYGQAVGPIQAIHAQCNPQVAKLNEEIAAETQPTAAE